MSIPQAFVLSLAFIAFDTPPMAIAAQALPFQLTQVYPDLPGVKSQAEAEKAKRVICEQSVIRIEGNPTYGPRYRTVNNCHRGDGPVFQSPRSPRSIERQLRGLNY